MRMKLLAGTLVLAISIISCNNNNSSSESTQDVDSDDICEYEYIPDSIGDHAVSHDCAIAYATLNEIAWKWEDVKSPSMLARARAAWKEDNERMKGVCNDFGGEDKRLLDSVCQVIKTTREEKIKGFSIPASSVIENLNNCIRRVEKMRNKDDMRRFTDVRLAMLDDLDIIHLCVEPNSHEIDKVKHLAHTLKDKYKEKCKEFGLQ
jgi:hypothetical protein